MTSALLAICGFICFLSWATTGSPVALAVSAALFICAVIYRRSGHE